MRDINNYSGQYLNLSGKIDSEENKKQKDIETRKKKESDRQKKKFNKRIEDMKRKHKEEMAEMQAEYDALKNEIDDDRRNLDEDVKYQDEHLIGKEKEYEVQKLLNYAKENDLKLSQDQLKILNQQGDLEKSKLDRIQKQLEIQRLQNKLTNLRKNKTIQQIGKNADGEWDMVYVADEDEINKTIQELKDAE
jgi:chromosome segregation ATPase